MISRYPAQFSQVGIAVFKELTPFINDNDMQTSALALKVAIPTITISAPSAPEAQAFIVSAVNLSRSLLI